MGAIRSMRALGLKDFCSPTTGQSTREENGAENDSYDDKGIALSCDHDEEHDRARGHKNRELERASHGP